MWSRLLAVWILFSTGALFGPDFIRGQEKPAGTSVEQEFSATRPAADGSLATIQYQASQREQPYFARLAPDEVTTGSITGDYDISTRNNKYVGWFGIVRKIAEDVRTNRTLLTVEHKYFDGLTDSHCQCLSFNGSGDFLADLKGTDLRIPPLSLVKVYGMVEKSKPDSSPKIEAEFVRNWHWGTFSFLSAYGTQRGNEEWRKSNTIPLDQIYESLIHPCHHYFELRLGKRPDTQEIIKRLIDTANAVTPEAKVPIERLAKLLPVGWPWSKEESFRQVREDFEIERLVKETGARQAVLKLLIQALQENDERVSSAAAFRFANLDPAGEAVKTLTQLLEHKYLLVRIRAATALGSGYGNKAALSVEGLTQCLRQPDPSLRLNAVQTLGSIGSEARSAIPELKRAVVDQDAGFQIAVAMAIWEMNRQPDEVMPLFIENLNGQDQSQQSTVIGQLKEMGPWAAAAVPALVKILESETENSRNDVIRTLGAIGPSASKAVPILVKILTKDKDRFCQAYAAEALGEIHDSQAIPFLIEACNNADDYVQSQAIDALTMYGHQAKGAVPALVKLIKNDSEKDWIAAQALGTIDADGASLSTLVEVLGSSKPNLRRFAAYGLKKLGTKAAAAGTALLPLLGDDDDGVRIAAAGAYALLSGKTDDAVRVLRAELRSTDFPESMWAANELADIGIHAKAAVPELSEKLKSKTHYVLTSAANALGKIGKDAAAAVSALTPLLEKSNDDDIRACVALALWRIDHSEKSPAIIQEILVNSKNSRAQSKAAAAAEEFHGPTAIWSPLLRPLLKNSDSFVRKAAEKALKRIEGQ